ncbi:HepT-like ribonuclease domain-containing protein [Rhodococcoides kyotonense]|uniref:Uncharacterized conserved protein, contains HEPN domain n=1 Tax=Rhodococcoides kyotonense TaxID=398843 RepID=A0A239KBU7_9NOCA|nr:HepT-like ribonuclease domain-containing protein [Rhodococcus kyotonensis]SNT15876.1 Uncharacterized conserved protein, contains HEPN domain [Rhodococcus kyotonensis]
MPKTPAPYLAAAIEALTKIRSARPSSAVELETNHLLWDATLMRVQVAGEYLSKVRDNFPEYYSEHQDDSWHKLIALRNIISHAYSDIDPIIMWDVISNRLDPLNVRLLSLADELAAD